MSRVDELKQRLAEINKPNVEGSAYHENFDIRSKQKGKSQIDKINDYKELGHSPAYNEMFESEMGNIPPSRVEGSGNPKGSGWSSELSTGLRMKGRTKKQKKEHPSGTSIPYSVFDHKKYHKQGHPTLEEGLSPENVKNFETWGNKYNIQDFDDPNIATISRENAKRFSKLKQRLAAVNSLNESQRFQRQSTDARTQGKPVKNKHKRKIGDITKREDNGFIRTPSGIETQKIPRGLSGGSKNNAVRQRRRQ